MKKITYNIFLALLFIGITTANAQKFKQNYNSEITKGKGSITLHADYADIKIVEWNKDKIKVDATMTVEGVTEEEAQKYFDFWKINLSKNNSKVHIVSSTTTFINNDFYDLEPLVFEMPEISIESLGVLDSMNFSFPEINFSEILNDSTFNKFKFYSLDENGLNPLNSNDVKETQKKLQEWQEANKENFKKLAEKAEKLAKMNLKRHKLIQKTHEKRLKKREELMQKVNEKRIERNKKLTEIKAKRQELHTKVNARRSKINHILKDRKKAKVRTKLTIKVPKGTNFNMNVNYSKISTD